MNKIAINSNLVFLSLLMASTAFALIFIAFLLIVPGYNATENLGIPALFNVNAEASIPTWYSQLLLFTAAALLFLCAKTSKSFRKHWYGLSGLFLFLSIDEGASIHELTTEPIRDFFSINSGPLYYSWIILYGALVLFLLVVLWKFIMSLNIKTRGLFVLSGAIFIFGAVILESMGAQIAAQYGETVSSYSFVVMAEEFFEMIGVSVFIYALTDRLVNRNDTFKLTFTNLKTSKS